MLQETAQRLAESAQLDWDTWGIWILIALKVGLVAAAFLPAISVIAMFSIWWERKVAGHIQCRLGPMHVGGWHGWAQSIADGVKLILKEDLMPRGADAFLFRLAPYLAFAPVFAAFLALPFGPQFVFENGLNIGVLYILAVLSVEVMGVILAGWASNSKWSVYGAMRAAAQLVAYEIPLGLAILCGVIVAGTLDLMELGYLQGAGLWDWFVFHNPFIFAAFGLYFVASLAENKRAPFDLPESESELVAGFHTEYSGLRFSFFFFAEYAGMFVVGAIQAALFLGGWNSPLGAFDPIYAFLGYDPVLAGQAYFSGATNAAIGWDATAEAMGLTTGAAGLAALNVYCLFWFVLKAMGLIFVQIWLRWTLPRIRIDQVLYACVKVLLPGALVMFTGVALWVWLVPQPAHGVVDGELVARLGHLVSQDKHWLQIGTQYVLTLAALTLVAAAVGVVVWAWVHRDKQPVKTFFPDVMPVSDHTSFTASHTPAAAPKPKTA